MIEIRADNWYFTAICKKCGALFGFAQAPDPAKSGPIGMNVESLTLVCDSCGAREEYQRHEILVRRVGQTN